MHSTAGAVERVKIELKNGSHYYIRNANATHLKEDLENWLEGKQNDDT